MSMDYDIRDDDNGGGDEACGVGGVLQAVVVKTAYLLERSAS